MAVMTIQWRRNGIAQLALATQKLAASQADHTTADIDEALTALARFQRSEGFA